MVVDSSALLAILLEEPVGELFPNKILSEPSVMSPPNLLESHMVLSRHSKIKSFSDLSLKVAALQIKIVPFTEEHAALAADAFNRFGKGRHPAALNFGDCIAYAVAKHGGHSLLFTGNDFSKTDILPA